MKRLFCIFIGAFIGFLVMMIGAVIIIDPFFHYHSPLKSIYYRIDNPRSQNIGIVGQYEYDAIITGTSLTQGFLASEFDEFFGTDSIKLPFPGATFYETEQVLEKAFESENDIKYVVRSLDVNHLLDDRNALREDLGVYPFYLYNDSIWDDYKYVCNEDTVLSYCVPEFWGLIRGKEGGHTSFDVYLRGNEGHGNWILHDEPFDASDIEKVPFGDADKNALTENVKANIIDLAKAHPETTFIYFIPPYNVNWWLGLVKEGKVDFTCDEIRYTMELLLECENIKLYCFAGRTDVTTDLDNYIDGYHYVNAIHSMILKWIKDDEDLINKDNYENYVEKLRVFYNNYEYYCDGTVE